MKSAASDQEMADIHDRKPLVLTPEHAREWLDPGLAPERAEEIANECCQPTEYFEWYTVGKAAGNVRSQGAELLLPSPSDDCSA